MPFKEKGAGPSNSVPAEGGAYYWSGKVNRTGIKSRGRETLLTFVKCSFYVFWDETNPGFVNPTLQFDSGFRNLIKTTFSV